LLQCNGYEQLRSSLGLSDHAAKNCAESDEQVCVGAVLTWQSTLGRKEDCVREWASLGISIETTAELMHGDHVCKAHFEMFVRTVGALVDQHGFMNFSACMELNPSRELSVVHLHAYVCADWSKYKGSKRVAGRIAPEQWVFDGYTPNVRFTNVRRNACPKKLMSGGLLYCAVPKIGSAFQYCSLTPGKDCCCCSCVGVPGA
jgi:hypothetical protein